MYQCYHSPMPPPSWADAKKQSYFPRSRRQHKSCYLGPLHGQRICSPGFGSCYRITASSLLDRQTCPQPTRIPRPIRCSRRPECLIRTLAGPSGFHRYNFSLRSFIFGVKRASAFQRLSHPCIQRIFWDPFACLQMAVARTLARPDPEALCATPLQFAVEEGG